MSTQHTPGPWHVSKASPTRVIESGPRGNAIAKMGLNLGVSAQQEAEANARLIAAAPDLIEFAEWVLSLKTGGMIEGRARAAIAKATGAS